MLEIRTKIGEGGRISIPANFREELHLSPGDEVILKIREGELRILTPNQALTKLRERIKSLAPNVSLTDQLIDMRRLEAKNE